MVWVIDYLCLALLLTSAVLVVAFRNVNASVVALSMLGTALTVLFVVMGAPDDAHAEIVVGAIALPTIYLIAIGKIRGAVEAGHEDQLGGLAGEDANGGGAGESGASVSGGSEGRRGPGDRGGDASDRHE